MTAALFPGGQTPRLLVVVPTLNEADNLPRLVERFFAHAPAAAELLVVDDASPDGTADVCRSLQARHPRLHLLERRGEAGLGRAYTAGLEWGLERGLERGYDVLGTMDADLSHDPAHLEAMLGRLEGHEVVVGSRYIRDGGTVNWGVNRVLLSWTANAFAASLLGMPVADVTSGFRLYRADALRRLRLGQLRSTGYSYLVELLFLLLQSGARVAESPILFVDRRAGSSKLRRREVPRGAVALARLRLASGKVPSPAGRAGRGVRGPVLASLVLAVVLVGLQAAAVLPLVADLPTWDQWSLVPLFEAWAEGRPVAPRLVAPYNGHYNLVARLAHFTLGVATHWDLRAEVYACYGVAALTLLVLLALLRQTDPRLLVLAAPLAAQLFSLHQYENFVSGFPLGQLLGQLFLTVALVTISWPPGSRRGFAVGCVAGVCASFSFASATVVWPAGIVGLLAGPSPGRWRRLGIWMFLAVPCVALAFGAARSAGIGVVWPAVPAFALALLGRPYAPQVVAPGPAAWLGVAALLGAAVTVALAARRHWIGILPWATLALSAVGAALLIALARAGADPGQALASHYVTAAYPLGLVVLVGLGRLALEPGAARAVRVASVLVASFGLLQPLVVSAQWSRTLREWAAIRDSNAVAIVAGTATDQEIRQTHHPRPGLVRHGVEVLRGHRLTLFADEPGPGAGEPLGWLDLVDGRPAHGDALCLPVGRLFELEGWAAGASQGWPADSVTVAVDGCEVQTLLETGRPRADVAQVRGRGFARSGFRLTAPALAGSEHELVVRARRGDREAVLYDRCLPTCPFPPIDRAGGGADR